MVAVECQQTLGIGAVGGMVSQAVNDLGRFLTGLLLDALTLDEEGLSYRGKIQIVVEGGGGPDSA